MRDALHRFVDQDLGPGDLVTILRPLDSLLTIRLTRDRDALHRAIDAFEGRRGDYAPRTAFERNYMVNDQARADVQRTQATWSTLNALALHLANLGAGRKTMLLVSEQADPMLRRRGLESLPTSSSVMRTANRANVVDLRPRSARRGRQGRRARRGAEPAQRARRRHRRRPVCAVRRVRRRGSTRALRQMVADASAYYLLTYRSARNTDGMFHAVDVSVKTQGRAAAGAEGILGADA